MSLTDKRIDITFDETNEEEMIAAITQTVYSIIKDVFVDSIIDKFAIIRAIINKISFELCTIGK